MIPKELFKKIRRIEITTSRLVTDIFAGQYHSVFKGEGIEFDEVREYNIGDDIRSIDWNVTARTNKVYVKKFSEERELSVMIIVDASMSTRFGSVDHLKSDLAAEIAAVLALAAIKNNDKVGLIIFTDKIEKFIPPRKGLRHVLRVVREILFFEPEGKGTDIPLALDYLNKVTTQKTVSFLISDFLSEEKNFTNIKKSMSIANRRHDLIAVTLNDPRDYEFPNCGLISLQDAESKRMITIDSSDGKFRKKFLKKSKEYFDRRTRLFHSIGVDHIDISTDRSYEAELVKFFKLRKKRMS